MNEGGTDDKKQYMNFELLLPTEVLVQEEVSKVITKAQNGSFCLLPRHIDFVAALVPGVLYYYGKEGEEKFAAVDEGILVKCGANLSVSTLNGVLASDLDYLQTFVKERFLQLDEHERKARTALARLEAGVLRSFGRLEKSFYD